MFARHPLLATLLLTAVTACDQPGAVGFADDATADAVTFRDCPTCQFNHPRANDFDFPEFNLDGTPNSDGTTIDTILSPEGVSYDLDVIDDEFAVTTAIGTLSGPDLIGWSLRVVQGEGANNVILVTINGWAMDTSGAMAISTYALGYDSDAGDPVSTTNVCPEYAADPDATVVTLIKGETYDTAAIEVVENQTRWVTLACANEATYKMKRHGYSPNTPAAPTTWQQRQATLKMITADYCGLGIPFTVPDTALHMLNASESVDSSEPLECPAVEAVWTHEGAVCIGTPRLPDDFPVEKIQSECPELPVCTPALLATQGIEWTTWYHDDEMTHT